MIDPVLRDEQPHPIRRAAANLNFIHRFAVDMDDGAPVAIEVAGILMSLDRTVRTVSNATHLEVFWTEARSLVQHAEAMAKLRDECRHTSKMELMPPIKEAHDALLEAADQLTNTEGLAAPF